MTAVCPACYRDSPDGLLCSNAASRPPTEHCTQHLETQLTAIPDLITDLNTTISRQDRMIAAGKGGLARERWAYRPRASIAADCLTNTLTTWAADICGTAYWTSPDLHPAITAAWQLRANLTDIRKHPAAAQLKDEIISGIEQARADIDQRDNRSIIKVGPCPENGPDNTECTGQVFAYFPTEEAKPPRMECRTNSEHTWTTMQWLRTGRRILHLIEKRKIHAA